MERLLVVYFSGIFIQNNFDVVCCSLCLDFVNDFIISFFHLTEFIMSYRKIDFENNRNRNIEVEKKVHFNFNKPVASPHFVQSPMTPISSTSSLQQSK